MSSRNQTRLAGNPEPNGGVYLGKNVELNGAFSGNAAFDSPEGMCCFSFLVCEVLDFVWIDSARVYFHNKTWGGFLCFIQVVIIPIGFSKWFQCPCLCTVFYLGPLIQGVDFAQDAIICKGQEVNMLTILQHTSWRSFGPGSIVARCRS